jgi:hypothetical protein
MIVGQMIVGEMTQTHGDVMAFFVQIFSQSIIMNFLRSQIYGH